MPFDIIIAIFALLSIAVYLLLNKNLVNIICGVVVLSNGVNIIILASSGNPEGKLPPIIQPESAALMADPLSQAMILTAIVIGFGMLAFLAALVYKVSMKEGTENTGRFFRGDE